MILLLLAFVALTYGLLRVQCYSRPLSSHITIRGSFRLFDCPTASEELTRFEAYTMLRKYFHGLIRDVNCDSRRGWIRCFERWQCVSSYIASNPIDPLIPSGSMDEMSIAEMKLVEDLKLLDNMSAEGAQYVATQLTRKASVLSSTLSTALSSRRLDGRNSNRRDSVQVRTLGNGQSLESGIELKLYREDASKALSNLQRRFAVNGEVLSRLSRRYTFTTGQSTDGDDFYESLFTLLCRYQALEGYGWQAAVVNPVLDCLALEFNVTAECFASPMNAHLEQYFSAFPDVDACFGSRGSFFKFSPTSGSFEANPPFVPFLMAEMVSHMESLLSRTSEPLSFAVIVPYWTDSTHWSALQRSSFNRGLIMLTPQQHTFLNGVSYQRPEADMYANRPAPFDSGIFFLQNDAGHAAYTVTPARELRLRDAFASVPVSQELLRKVGAAADVGMDGGDREGADTLPRYIPKRLREREGC